MGGSIDIDSFGIRMPEEFSLNVEFGMQFNTRYRIVDYVIAYYKTTRPTS